LSKHAMSLRFQGRTHLQFNRCAKDDQFCYTTVEALFAGVPVNGGQETL